jgi:hypothetical protein
MLTASQINTPIAGASVTCTIQLFDPQNLQGNWILAGSPSAVVNCQGAINCKPPAEQSKPVPCGLNSAAYKIGGMTKLGHFGLSALDFSNYDNLRQFNGYRCVATLVSTVQGVVILTEIFYDFDVALTFDIPKGDGERTITIDQATVIWYSAINPNSGSSNYYYGNASGITETFA